MVFSLFLTPEVDRYSQYKTTPAGSFSGGNVFGLVVFPFLFESTLCVHDSSKSPEGNFSTQLRSQNSQWGSACRSNCVGDTALLDVIIIALLCGLRGGYDDATTDLGWLRPVQKR